MFMMCHSFAYFTYDSVIEIYYGTDDLLTNAHHVIVVGATYFHLRHKYGGYEYIGKIAWIDVINQPSSVTFDGWGVQPLLDLENGIKD